MDVLHQNGITVDDFRDRSAPVELALLTHAHSDSRMGRLPKKLYCHPRVRSDLVALGYRHLEPGADVFHFQRRDTPGRPLLTTVPFPTTHCCGSTGFWFPNVGVLYVGDGRVDNHLLHTVRRVLTSDPVPCPPPPVLRVIGDGLFDRVLGFPPLLTVANWVLEWTQVGFLQFVCIHSGHTHFVHRFLQGRVHITCPADASWTKKEVASVVKDLCTSGQRDVPNRLVLVPPKRERAPRPEEFVAVDPAQVPALVFRRVPESTPVTIVASAMWFVVYRRDPATVFWHEPTGQLRVCLSFHADALEKHLLLEEVGKLVPNQVRTEFSACPTRGT